MYIDSLIGPDTVNTVPPTTYVAYKDHGQPRETLTEGLHEAEQQMAMLKNIGIDLDAVTNKLEDDGVQSFATSFTNLLNAISAKTELLRTNKRAVG